ncbi:Rpn family recombination-promoting nuclease/putative transposase [Desertifilum sp. FACHB-1129]|uniref:Flagellar assembly protein H n=2 Tax=Desertifilum tharense IPPAS B-1220 TaxID=1781255 RepID=A0A1E5QP26_9CYAN|nr:Rpn family recombination-promoting nuclease/putative transposase [Desertifilum tharense]MBD2312893.1 Rpn family recombination-promoting nuclease/putative transposase [Desertifilum sp. FACHB-1129]MBD2323769.1 Rpn family recombination-promoting nuclease/putative transposase [Desertifilum sp. FACHB-866]MBD2333614.1 Rpn family recombination-promoting nuclease/putative transposase [Desertifilum sp. FACHB-868]MDA0210697.1 Rpn family recombination-promoting nuclease/putative transposase [Cyanobacte
MKTDSIFYRIFQQYPRSFFELLQRPPNEANLYQFTSVEVKQLAFRLDGLFLPTTEEPNQPFYLVEVQFQPDEAFYYRIFAELFLYLRQYQPSQPWQFVVLYPNRSIEREHPHQFRELIDSNRVTRIYLNELEETEGALGLNIIKLIVKPETEAIETAKRLIAQAQQELPAASLQQDIVDLIETIVIYKLPQASREEIATMLGLTDLKQTRFYQEAFAEGREEGIEQGVEQAQRDFVQRLASRGNSLEEIAELVELPLDVVQQILQSSDRSQT